MTDYEGVDAKLGRAVEHLETFESELASWVQAQSVSFDPKPNADGTGDDLFVKINPAVPDSFDLVVGDCVHNFRSVLDHLAMALAIDNGADSADTSISWPICDGFRRFYGYDQTEPPVAPPRWAGAYKIRTLRPAAQAYIEGLQPHIAPPALWELSQLQFLDNTDKHQALIGHHVEVVATLNAVPGMTIDYEQRLRLKNGAKLATVTFDPSYSGVKVYPALVAEISVNRVTGMGFVPIQGFLRDLLLPLLQDIVNRTKRQFP